MHQRGDPNPRRRRLVALGEVLCLCLADDLRFRRVQVFDVDVEFDDVIDLGACGFELRHHVREGEVRLLLERFPELIVLEADLARNIDRLCSRRIDRYNVGESHWARVDEGFL